MSRPRPISLPWLAVLLAWWLVWPAVRTWAGVTAEVEPREVELGQSVVLRVLVDGEAAADIDLSPLAAFSVIPRGRALGSRVEAGRTVPVAAYRFELTPSRAGEGVIPPLAVATDGQTVHTPSLRVLVRPRSGPPPDLAGRDLLLTAQVTAVEPFEGEQFRYILRLFRLRAVEAATITPPDFPGFTVTPLPGQRDSEVAVDGRRYAVTEVAYRLTARRTGRVTLAPGTAVCREAVSPDRAQGSRTRTVTGPSLAVTVRPLPPFTGPGRFAGVLAGGTLSARLEPPNPTQGPGPVLAVTVTGQGDPATLGAPRLILPQGQTARPLPPQAPDQAGRIFRYALSLAPSDSRAVPSAELTVFDPVRSAYLLLRASPERPVPTNNEITDPLPALSLAPTRGAATPSWPLVLLGALLGPAGYLTLRAWQGRRTRQAAEVLVTPSTLAEALRCRLAQSATADPSEAGRALARLDRLLYSGRSAEPGALDAAVHEARRILAGRSA